MRAGAQPAEPTQLDGVSLDDRQARFMALAGRRLDHLYRLAGLLLGNASDAEDVSQEALATAWRSFANLRDESRFDAWLDRILVNACRDRQRRRRVVRFVPIEGEHSPVADPFAAVLDHDAALRHLAVLDIDERAVVVLHYWADLPLTEVAAQLNIATGTVKSRLHRALTRMRADEPAEAST